MLRGVYEASRRSRRCDDMAKGQIYLHLLCVYNLISCFIRFYHICLLPWSGQFKF